MLQVPASEVPDQHRPPTVTPTATPAMTPADPTAALDALPDTDHLPDDPATLKGMILELLATLAETRHEREQLQERIHLLLHRLYGRKSERFDPNQLMLFGDLNQPADTPPAADGPSPGDIWNT